MTNLPINISNVPAKTAASKPAGNDNAAQQDAQGFGNVLARQVEDSAKPAESSANAAKQPAEQDKAEPVPVDNASSLPVDILAALLAQQNPAVTLQPEIINQAVINAQTTAITTEATGTPGASVTLGASGTPGATGTPEASVTAVATDKKAGAALALISAGDHPSKTAIAALDTERPKVEISAKDSKGFADTFMALDKKELNSPTSNLPLRGNVISELATAAPQSVPSQFLHGTTAPSGSISASISTAVAQPAWGEEFCQKITWIATQHNQSAELHLNPPQLGPLDVVLKINGDQASATFTSPHAAVRDAIEQALPKLREMLADNGIMLGNAMVNDQATKNGQDSSSQKPQRGTPNSAAEGATDTARIQETRVSSISRHNGMVDTFA